MKTSISCPCEYSFEVEIPESLDIQNDPKVIEDCITGDFLSFTCPDCNSSVRPDFPVLIEGFTDNAYASLYFVPEIERSTVLLGKSPYSADRLAIGRSELSEKCKIYRAGLDDRCVEAIKLLLLEKAENPDGLKLFFQRCDEKGDLELYIHGLKEDELGVSTVPRAIYSKMCNDIEQRLKEDPFREILNGNYISVRKVSLEV